MKKQLEPNERLLIWSLIQSISDRIKHSEDKKTRKWIERMSGQFSFNITESNISRREWVDVKNMIESALEMAPTTDKDGRRFFSEDTERMYRELHDKL